MRRTAHRARDRHDVCGPDGSIDLVTSTGCRDWCRARLRPGQGGVAAEGMVAVSASRGQLYGQFGGNTVGVGSGSAAGLLGEGGVARPRPVRLGGRQRLPSIAGVGDHDFAWANKPKHLVPDQFPDSNPNGVLVTGGGGSSSTRGRTRSTRSPPTARAHVLTFLGTPDRSPTDSVPTCAAKGPDGALYVAELLGGNFAPGNARVWRIDVSSGGAKKSVWARGLTTVQGCGFDRWGNFYATEFEVSGLDEADRDPRGAVVKIAPTQAHCAGPGPAVLPVRLRGGQGRLGLRVQLQHRSGVRLRAVPGRWPGRAHRVTRQPLTGTHRRRPAWERRRWLAWYEGRVPDANASTQRLLSLAGSASSCWRRPLYVLVDTAVIGHLGTSRSRAWASGRAAHAGRHRRDVREYGTTGRAARAYGSGDLTAAFDEGVQASWSRCWSASQ